MRQFRAAVLAAATRATPVVLVLVWALVFAAGARGDAASVGTWHLDGATAGTTPDASGTGNTGTDVGGTITTGRFGNGLQLASAGHGFLVGAREDLLRPTSVTTLAWVRRSGTPGPFRTIVGKAALGCSDSAYAIYTGSSGGLQAYVTVDVAGTRSIAATTQLAPSDVWDGQWHAVGMTFDEIARRLTLYLDGRAVSEVSAPSSVIDHFRYTGEKRLGVGRYPDGACSLPGFQYTGTLDEMRVYPRALNAGEMAWLQNSPGPDPRVLPAPTADPPVTPVTPTADPVPSPPPPPRPLASFSAPSRGSAFSPVVLNAGATTGATRLQWDFDSDGKIDLTSPPRDSTVRLTFPGNKTLPVKLIVTGAGGTTDTKVQNVTFTPSKLISSPVLKQLPAVLTSGPPEISAATSVLANRPCIDGTTVVFRLVEARGCFVRTEDAADVPAAERALGQAHYFDEQYSVPAVVNAICRKADLGEVPRSRCADAKAMFKKPQEFYVSRQAIKLNGITIRPRNGKSIVLLPAAERLLAADAVMIWNGITVKTGALDLNLVDQVKAIAFGQRAKDFPTGRAPLFTFDGNTGIPDIAGFKIDGAISLSIGATDGKRWSEGAISLRLPPTFSLFGGNPPSASTSLRADNDNDPVLDQLKITVPEAYIGAVRFTDLSFEYRLAGGIDGDTNPGTSCTRKEWKARGNVFISGGKSGEAGFRLTAPPSQNGVGFCNGSFKHAGGALQFGGPIPKPVLFPGILLDEVNFALQLDPFLVRGGGQISVGEVATVKGALLLAFPTASRPYVLNERDAGREFKQLAGKRFTSPTVAVGGDVGVKVPEFGTLGFGNAALMYSYPDYVFFGGQVRLILPGLAVTGGVSGEMSLATKRFQLGGEGQACLGIDVVCVGANANVGSRGFSACGKAGISPGGGYRYADKYIGIWPIDGCKPSQFWITDVRARTASGARAAQAGVLSFTKQAGEAVKQLRLTGETAAPQVTVRGPSGKTLAVTGDNLTYAPGDNIGAMRELTGKRTFISLDDGPGTYTVTPEPGSAKITEAAESRKGYDSEYDAEVSAAEGKRTLKYDLGPKGGDQQVIFYEKGQDVFKQIGTAKSGKGEIEFTPADGQGGTREIVAVATINGLPIPEQTVAKFKAAAEAAVKPPTDVEVQRRGNGLVVTWEKAEQAKAYGIVVRQADGEVTRHRAGKADESLRIAKVQAEFAGTVTVSAQGEDNEWSKPGEAARYKRTEAPFTVLQTSVDNEKRDAAKERAQRKGGG
ncbi:LamG domain-containing protein [Svornostia abyssi]|uniref:LamG domain-containing protein n=1 Tax=Svornostia abyssi TaxID=2898438 RepID=A0ABY5PLK4_9ACTN|nr:LamG domain-containing protein [Parviterribacteraceae bacterium J379]